MAWEGGIPFVPWMLVPYLSLGVLAACVPLLRLADDELAAFTRRMAAATIVAGVCYVLWPLELAAVRPSAEGVLGQLYEMVKDTAPATNLCPSLHVTYAVIFGAAYRRRLRGCLRPATDAWCVLVVVSVVFVHQHHVVDVAGGLVLGVACVILIPFRGRRLMLRMRPVR